MVSGWVLYNATLVIVLSTFINACVARVTFQIPPGQSKSTWDVISLVEAGVNKNLKNMWLDWEDKRARDSILRKLGGPQISLHRIEEGLVKLSTEKIRVLSVGDDLGRDGIIKVAEDKSSVHLGLAFFSTQHRTWFKVYEVMRVLATIHLSNTDTWVWDPEHAVLSRKPRNKSVGPGYLEIDAQWTADWKTVVQYASSEIHRTLTFWALWGYESVTRTMPPDAGRDAKHNSGLPTYGHSPPSTPGGTGKKT